jgi:membrane-associated protein
VTGERALLVAHMLGMDWMDPTWLFDHFHTQFIWVCLVIVFVECGLFFPFLPGDTLLFSVGLFISATGAYHLDIGLPLALFAFTVAAFLGNVVGYEIGRLIGPPLSQHDGRILKKKYFDQTHEFFDRHGNKALVIGRFVPFVRTYITVVAGIGRMDRRRFALWSAVGAVLWVLAVTLLGYFLGKRFPGLAGRIDKAILVLLLLTVIPIAVEWWRRRRHQQRTRREAPRASAPTPESTRS